MTATETIATDGHQLMRVTRPAYKAESFPVVPGAPAPVDEHKPFLMPAEDALRIAKELPTKATIPILANAAICAETDSGDHRVIPITTTDLSSGRTHTVRVPSGNFPDVDRIMPDPNASTFKIVMDAKRLKDLLTQFEKFTYKSQKHAIRLYFTKDNAPMRIDADGGDGQHMTAVLMPLTPSYPEVLEVAETVTETAKV